MTEKITELYALGNGYKKISRLLGIPSDSVKSYIRRHGKHKTNSSLPLWTIPRKTDIERKDPLL